MQRNQDSHVVSLTVNVDVPSDVVLVRVGQRSRDREVSTAIM